MLAAKGGDGVAIARDERRRHQTREMGGKELLGRVAHADGIVDHQRLVAHMLQEMGCGDVGHVEGRVLPHQDHVHGGEIEHLLWPELEVPAVLALHLERLCARAEPPVAQHQLARQVVIEGMAAPLRFERQHEG
jgi:hypothetical protein